MQALELEMIPGKSEEVQWGGLNLGIIGVLNHSGSQVLAWSNDPDSMSKCCEFPHVVIPKPTP